MPDSGNTIGQLFLATLLSSAVVSSVIGIIFRSYVTRVEQRVRSQQTWKEISVAKLLGPVSMQLSEIRVFR
jgi:hypothetical protein